MRTETIPLPNAAHYRRRNLKKLILAVALPPAGIALGFLLSALIVSYIGGDGSWSKPLCVVILGFASIVTACVYYQSGRDSELEEANTETRRYLSSLAEKEGIRFSQVLRADSAELHLSPSNKVIMFLSYSKASAALKALRFDLEEVDEVRLIQQPTGPKIQSPSLPKYTAAGVLVGGVAGFAVGTLLDSIVNPTEERRVKFELCFVFVFKRGVRPRSHSFRSLPRCELPFFKEEVSPESKRQKEQLAREYLEKMDRDITAVHEFVGDKLRT